jgi:hypothetical protein
MHDDTEFQTYLKFINENLPYKDMICYFKYISRNVVNIEVHINRDKIGLSKIMLIDSRITMTLESFLEPIECKAYSGESCTAFKNDEIFSDGHLTLCIILSIAYANLRNMSIEFDCSDPKHAFLMYKIYRNFFLDRNESAAQKTVTASYKYYMHELFCWSRSTNFTTDYGLFCNFFKRYPTMESSQIYNRRNCEPLTYTMTSTNYKLIMVRSLFTEWLKSQANLPTDKLTYCTSCVQKDSFYRRY